MVHTATGTGSRRWSEAWEAGSRLGSGRDCTDVLGRETGATGSRRWSGRHGTHERSRRRTWGAPDTSSVMTRARVYLSQEAKWAAARRPIGRRTAAR
jgi:hypothetical protein